MTKKEPVAPAFGAFLCKLQSEQLVNGRRLTNATIAQETMMSTKQTMETTLIWQLSIRSSTSLTFSLYT